MGNWNSTLSLGCLQNLPFAFPSLHQPPQNGGVTPQAAQGEPELRPYRTYRNTKHMKYIFIWANYVFYNYIMYYINFIMRFIWANPAHRVDHLESLGPEAELCWISTQQSLGTPSPSNPALGSETRSTPGRGAASPTSRQACSPLTHSMAQPQRLSVLLFECSKR